MANVNPSPNSERITPAVDNLSLIRGGPFYRLQNATHLLTAGRWNLGRRITLAIAIGWLPLVLMTVLFHPSALRSLISDYRVTARMLIAVPILLVGQVVMDSRFRLIVRHLRRSGLLDSDSLADMDVIIAKLIRWRDSLWPELAIILVVYASIALVFSTHLHENRPWALAGEGASHLLPAGWYYGFCEPTCVPLPYRTEPVEMAFVVLFPIPPGTLEFAINAYSP